MSAADNLKPDNIRRNTDARIVTSVIVGLALFGVITYFAVKSGVKPLKTVANVVKGGK